jgi:membrane protein implicated in regulation of membrane protease activity
MTDKDQDLVLNYEEKSRIEILKALYERGYSREAAIEKLLLARIPNGGWKGSIAGASLIALAVLYIVTSKTTGSFNFSLNSSGDVLRLNEWVLKPFIIANFLLLGALLLIHRENFPFRLKTMYLVIIGLAGFFELLNNYAGAFLISAVAFVVVLRIKEFSRKIASSTNIDFSRLSSTDDEKAFTLIENGFQAWDIESVLAMNYWKGNILFPVFLLTGVLFLSAPISIDYGADVNEKTFRVINMILMNLLWLTLIIGVLLGISERIISRTFMLIFTTIYFIVSVVVIATFGLQLIAFMILLLSIVLGTLSWRKFKKNAVTKDSVPQ